LPIYTHTLSLHDALPIYPETLPDWLTGEDIDFYTAEFQRTGFRGGLNWYRNFDRNWELLGPFSGAKIMQPALFIWGENDPVFEIDRKSTRLNSSHVSISY